MVETVLRDRPYADVAAELGVTPGTLRTRVHYGLRRLRCLLETGDQAAGARIIRAPAAFASPWPRSFTLLRRLPERRDERLRERFFGVGVY